MTSHLRLAVLLVSAPIVLFAVLGGFLGRASAGENVYQHLRVFEDVVSLILNNYVEEVEVERVLVGAMRGLTDALDADSAFLSAEDVDRLERGEPVPAGTTGLSLTRQYYLRVVAARDGSPAARAGLRPGDYVRAIDGRSTRDMSAFEGMHLMRGEPGSPVVLTVIRGSAAEPHQVELVREDLDAPDVTARPLGDGLGYIRIAAFSPDVAAEIRTRAEALARDGVTQLVVDVRRTADGPLDAGLDAARLFIPSGTLAVRQDRGDVRQPIDARNGDGAVTMPVALLVNGGTAGAAELFAAALSANDRAELIGEPTVGRAATQRLVRLGDGSGLWISATRYLTAAGDPIHEHGLEPHVVVEEPELEFGASIAPDGDPVLDRAIDRLMSRQAA